MAVKISGIKPTITCPATLYLPDDGGKFFAHEFDVKRQIDDVTANAAGQLTPSFRAERLRALQGEFDMLAEKIRTADEQQQKLNASAAGQPLSLTVAGAEQAWRKANDGVKTAISIQQEYTDKLSASRSAWEQYRTALEQQGAGSEKIKAAQAEQDQVERQLAAERDKKIKDLSAGAATARAQGIDAEIAATKQGYKLLAAQTADSLAEVDALRKHGVIDESEALERRTALQLADIDAQRAALQAELALLQGRKDSAKEQANIQGELAELAQRRANTEAQAARQQQELDAQAADALEQRIEGYERAAQQAQESLRTAKLDTLEIGKTGAALGALRQARVEDAAAELERQAATMDGIDLSGRASKALREQAQAMRELAKVQSYNESARMVHDYAKAIDEANAATQFELSLTTLSQREREIALEQYRIAIDLKKRLEEIDARNPADRAGAERLKAEASEAAARAQAAVVGRVYARETTRTVDQINDTFRQGFADMLNRGEDAWDAFNKSMATTFKTTVANELYKAFAEPFVVNNGARRGGRRPRPGARAARPGSEHGRNVDRPGQRLDRQRAHGRARRQGISNADIARVYGVETDYIDSLFEGIGVKRFASGGAFRNGIVTRPTFFDVGQMGEAGEEAILPLANVGGRLGVHALGGKSDPETVSVLRQLLQQQYELLRTVIVRLDGIETLARKADAVGVKQRESA